MLQEILRALWPYHVEYRIDTAKQLRLGVQYIHECAVEGDVAEFGIGATFTAQVLAKAMSPLTCRRLHLFDSFRGLPESTARADFESPHVRSGVWRAGALHAERITPERVRGICGRYMPEERALVYPGWFKETIADLTSPLALLHIDCDLYQSATDVLDSVFSRGLVSEGAVVFFDDWNCNRASPHFGERRAWAEAVEKYHIIASNCGDYGFASHKLIVHDYRR